MNKELLVKYHRATCIALIKALQSDNPDLVYARVLSEQHELQEVSRLFSESLTLSVSDVFSLDSLPLVERQQLLFSVLEKHGLSDTDLHWTQNVELSYLFASDFWHYFHARAVSFHQAISSHVELSEGEAWDFPRQVKIPKDACLLFYLHRGKVTLRIDGEESSMVHQSPAIILITSPSLIEYERHPDSSSCSIFYSLYSAREIGLNLFEAQPIGLQARSVELRSPLGERYVQEIFYRIIEISHSDIRRKQAIHMLLIQQLLLLVDSFQLETARKSLDRRISLACEYLRDNLGRKISVADIAGRVNMTGAAFSSLFKQQMGVSPLQWRDQVRMEKAKHMLKDTEQAVKVIAYELGYDDPHFFSRRFKQITGWSPSQIRNLER